MFNKKVKSILFVLGAITLSSFTHALPASECKPKYDDCMDTWYSSSSACYGDYKLCRGAPGEE